MLVSLLLRKSTLKTFQGESLEKHGEDGKATVRVSASHAIVVLGYQYLFSTC